MCMAGKNRWSRMKDKPAGCSKCLYSGVPGKETHPFFWTSGGKSSWMWKAASAAAGYAKDAAKPIGTGMAEDAAWCAVDDCVGIAGCAAKEERKTGGWRFNQEDDEWDHDWSGLWTLNSTSIINHEWVKMTSAKCSSSLSCLVRPSHSSPNYCF